jgi:hypothetical protein
MAASNLTVSHPEALKLGYTSFQFWEAAKRVPRKKEWRTIERNGLTFKRELSVVLLKELKKRKQVTNGSTWITPQDASTLTKGAFTVMRMEYWEDAHCPFLEGRKRKLDVDYRDAIVPATWKGRETTRFIKNAKHYRRKQILRAWKGFKCVARKGGNHIDEDGAIWLSSRAAFKQHKVREQALRHWHEKGWLDGKLLPWRGSGRHRQHWFFRVRGKRGILGLLKRQRPGDGHIVMPEPEAAKGAESRTRPHEERLERVAPTGHPTYFTDEYHAKFFSEMRELQSDVRQLVERLSGSGSDRHDEVDDNYISARDAASTTALRLDEITRLCESGKVRSRKPFKNRRRVHAGDLARFVAQRARN